MTAQFLRNEQQVVRHVQVTASTTRNCSLARLNANVRMSERSCKSLKIGRSGKFLKIPIMPMNCTIGMAPLDFKSPSV